VGTATVGLTIDSAFVDGIRQSTILDSAMYAGNKVSATTFTAPDGVTRMIGITETNSSIQNTVLKEGQDYKGSVSILNQQSLAVFSPLKDTNNNVIGMLFIGIPQTSVLQTAGHAVEMTFLVTAILLILTIIPAYLISKHIARQLD
jgi:methyl-accepting chemotaxis protein